jgi:phage/plasmid-like protein (TIGR03299 family)|tara:strand:- start:2860 stop:3828 length:969 start_codon:yes stop_codon:yes gene_type:complete
MSHEVEIIDGQAQMAYAGELPWHGLGTKVASDLAPSQIMQQAGLDWSVEKETMTTASGVEIEGKKALVRSSDNKVLDVVGDNWNPVQNSEAFEFFSEYCLAGDMEMHTAGSLKGGQMVWALAKVKESFDILGGDQVDSYLLFSNPHKYGKAIDVRFTPIRVVCNNTLSMSLGQNVANSVSLNHRTAFNPESVKQTMGIAHEKFAQYKETCEFLASKKFNMNSLIQYYNEIFPRTYQGKQEVNVKDYNDLTNNAQKAFSFLETQPGAKFGEGSWWSALNSVTYLTDHKMGREADSRLTSAWFGANQTRKVKAVEKAVEFALAS